MGKDKESVKYLKMILETMDFEYASKFASVIDRARQAGLTDYRELREMLEETHPEAVEVWEEHLYSNRDAEYENMSFREFQAGLRGNDADEKSEKTVELPADAEGTIDEYGAEIEPESEAEETGETEADEVDLSFACEDTGEADFGSEDFGDADFDCEEG